MTYYAKELFIKSGRKLVFKLSLRNSILTLVSMLDNILYVHTTPASIYVSLIPNI